jgi:predicted MPP superfamily phosphohydrolase
MRPQDPRRLALLGAAALGVGAAAVLGWSVGVAPGRLAVRHVALALPAWPRTLDGLRVAVVSDLHTGAPHMDAQAVGRVVRLVADEAPDLVVLLGDYVDPAVVGGRPIAPEVVARRLAGLRAPLGVVGVLGNHDWVKVGRRMPEALAEEGIRALENEAVRVRDGDPALWVAGVADLRTRVPDVGLALREVPESAVVILLAHDPDVFPAVPRRVALTLSGHLHGGQVDLPGLRRLAIPSRYGTRYLAGHVVEDGRHLFVTTGVGTSGWPVRLLARPEVVVLELRPEDAA